MATFRLEELPATQLEQIVEKFLTVEGGYYVRYGFITKSEKQKGRYHVVDSAFSSPSDLSAVEIEWIENSRPNVKIKR